MMYINSEIREEEERKQAINEVKEMLPPSLVAQYKGYCEACDKERKSRAFIDRLGQAFEEYGYGAETAMELAERASATNTDPDFVNREGNNEVIDSFRRELDRVFETLSRFQKESVGERFGLERLIHELSIAPIEKPIAKTVETRESTSPIVLEPVDATSLSTLRHSLNEAMLKDNGFSVDDLSDIEREIPDLNVKVLKFSENDSIQDIADAAVSLSSQMASPVVFKFKDVLMVVKQDQSVKGVIEGFDDYYKVMQRIRAYAEKMRIAYEQLSEPLKAWVSRCNESQGEDVGRWKECLPATNIKIALDAQLIAKTFKTANAVRNWHSNYGKREPVPGFDNDHSGNTLGVMVGLACALIETEGRLDSNRTPLIV